MFSAWDPLRQLEALRREIERVFGEADLREWRFPFSPISFLPGRAARVYPLLNLNEDKDAFHVVGLAPGADPESINIEVLGDQLTISGDKPVADSSVSTEAYHRNERAAGRFVRTVTLPGDVDQDKITASYKEGLLHVALPKAEAAKPKQIEVKLGG
jgi:HSP20 family protein